MNQYFDEAEFEADPKKVYIQNYFGYFKFDTN